MEDDKLKRLFQNIDLDGPGADFADNIMKLVETEDALSLNAALLAIVKNELLAEPSLQFSNNLMANIQPEVNKTAIPVISKKVWLVISGIILLVSVLVLIYSHSSLHSQQNNSYFSRFDLNLSVTTMAIIKIAGSVLPYLIPLSVLLLMDYFFRSKEGRLSLRKQEH